MFKFKWIQNKNRKPFKNKKLNQTNSFWIFLNDFFSQTDRFDSIYRLYFWNQIKLKQIATLYINTYITLGLHVLCVYHLSFHYFVTLYIWNLYNIYHFFRQLFKNIFDLKYEKFTYFYYRRFSILISLIDCY